MKKIIIMISALLTLTGVHVATATASSASTSGEACVFNAPALFFGLLGHVGWGFELPGGNWEYGANKGPFAAPLNMTSDTVWTTGSKAKMLTWFTTEGGYTQYRCATVPGSNASAAEQEVKNDQRKLYVLVFEDCETQVYKVLNEYGVKNMPSDVRHAAPNDWFSLLNQAGFGTVAGLPASAPASAPAPAASSPPKTYVYSVYHTCANGACGLNLHSGPGYSNYPVTRVLVDGDAVYIVCQTRGQSVSGIDGSSSDVWDKTVQGDYAADFYIDTPGMTGSFSPPIPQC